ncbi:MAG: hypothetical protein JWN59_1329 [Sphingomonas bacterium]|nr:hypothetical protein [Sphingomonas bacterium]
MLIPIIALLAASGGGQAAGAGPVCQNNRPEIAGQSLYRGRGATAKRLGDLPPANLVLTVLRREDGCEVPVIVRYGIGTLPAHGK